MNPSFPNELITRVVPRWELPTSRDDVQLYQLREAFTFISPTQGPIVAPVGFISDLGSVLRVIKAVIDNDDPDLIFASIPHDLLYQRAGNLGDGRVLTRRQSDVVLAEAMMSVGSPWFKIKAVFEGVRLGGRSHWGQLPKIR